MDDQDPQTIRGLERIDALIQDSQERLPSPLPTPEWRSRLRTMQRLSIDEVAQAVGVSRSSVYAWEVGAPRGGCDPAGRNRVLYAELLRRLAELHGVTPEMARSGSLVRATGQDK